MRPTTAVLPDHNCLVLYRPRVGTGHKPIPLRRFVRRQAKEDTVVWTAEPILTGARDLTVAVVADLA